MTARIAAAPVQFQMRVIRLAALALAGLVGLGVTSATVWAATSSELPQIIDRAGRYVVGYAQVFRNVLANEFYQQAVRTGELGRPILRVTEADLMVVTLPGAVPWVTFRDVYEVDGQPVRNREVRLEKLFRDPPASAVAQARALLEESSRYNLGPVHRTVNAPNFALVFLQPDNRARFAFERRGEQTIGGVKSVVVAFAERERPTLVRDDFGNDVPCKGRLWIDPADGAVLRSVVDYEYAPSDTGVGAVSARISTDYQLDPRLGIRVPVEMQERYDVAESPAARLNRSPRREGVVTPEDARDSSAIHIQATARYSGYRRFEVQTEETFRATPEPPK